MVKKPTNQELEQRVRELMQAKSKRKIAEKALWESEEKYKLITETSQTGIYIHQGDIIKYANNRFAELHGYTVEELIGTNYFNLFHPDERERALGIKSKRLRGDKDAPQYHETKRVKKDGGILWCQTIAVRIEYQGKPAIMGNVVDITARKLAEAQRDRFVLKLQTTLKRVETLSDISKTVNQSLNLDQVLNEAMDRIMELFKPHSAHIRILDEQTQELVLAVHIGLTPEDLKKLPKRLKMEEAISRDAIKSGRAVIIEDVLTDPRTAGTQSFAEKIGCRTLITLPLLSKNKILGHMSIRDCEPKAFTAEEILLFTSIGHQVGTAIENAKLYQQAHNNIKALKDAQEEREKIIVELQNALAEVKTLSGLLPICSHCKKIRDDRGYWDQIESYVMKYSDAKFSHGICPECAKKYYPDYNLYDD